MQQSILELAEASRRLTKRYDAVNRFRDAEKNIQQRNDGDNGKDIEKGAAKVKDQVKPQVSLIGRHISQH
jgi:hypothetical protein